MTVRIKWFLTFILLIIGVGFTPSNASVLPAPDHLLRVPHPFYISVTEINHNAKDKTIEISCKMFADDFEQILEKNYKTQLDIASDKDKASFDKLIPDYM